MDAWLLKMYVLTYIYVNRILCTDLKEVQITNEWYVWDLYF